MSNTEIDFEIPDLYEEDFRELTDEERDSLNKERLRYISLGKKRLSAVKQNRSTRMKIVKLTEVIKENEGDTEKILDIISDLHKKIFGKYAERLDEISNLLEISIDSAAVEVLNSIGNLSQPSNGATLERE